MNVLIATVINSSSDAKSSETERREEQKSTASKHRSVASTVGRSSQQLWQLKRECCQIFRCIRHHVAHFDGIRIISC